ncbi:pimeloyl-ACP methyl ester carboxylesterase [Actinocorallia herbida]|uniref:Pimeloyl-ACP methyl ester carboxylesterase n=1 Tax=Actinocorallia herbida TaxID=58109 RepID=A0A3N1DCR0_9ACTN|nr:alpha/beta hydrolase [Actinocorallia herbida]ROO91256.1 pimeloyl-ACP methyl ester carboxylesterase [Actinocorallia herbida]
MDGRSKRRLGIAGAVAGVGAAGVGAVVAARQYAVGRVRAQPDPEAAEPFGEPRGDALTVLADDGLPLYVEVEEPETPPAPGTPTLVFCHGYCLNLHTWHYQRRDLTGFRRITWDQRSHGRSGRSDPRRATIDQTGADLAAVLRATVGRDEPVVLVGHSMGGMTLMAFAERHPEEFGGRVRGVALVNTSMGDIQQMTLGLPLILAKVAQPLAPRVIRGLGRRGALVDSSRAIGADLAFWVIRRMGFADRTISPTVVDFVERMVRATPFEVIAEFYPTLIGHDKRAALAVLDRVPALVMTGDADLLTPAAHGAEIAAGLTDVVYVAVEPAGHLLPMEHHARVTEAVRALAGRVTAAPPRVPGPARGVEDEPVKEER